MLETPAPNPPANTTGAGKPNGLPRTVTLLVNTKARRGQEWFAKTQECLRAEGMTIEAAHAVSDPSRLPDMASQAIAGGAKLVAIGGGDGTFRALVGHFLGTDATLGVLPLGTVNDFARNLGIEATVEASCRAIAHGRAERISLGRANDDYFVITASVGFSAQTQHSLSPGLKKAFGPLGYMIASALALRKLKPQEITLENHSNGGESECLRVMQAGVINGHSWMGGKVEIPSLALENGRLAFYAVPMQSGWAMLRLARNLGRGRFFRTPGLRAFTTTDMTLTTGSPQPLVIDGDLCGQTPVRFRVVPNAIQVCVPEDYVVGGVKPE